ncbi:PREDICTED: cytochrome P450 9e2-like [Vollenhovia emeryi]|uniref:cytochrome P450 9e2-like n=1 Tax=Vollenhovia emeryi TaxID=411798 RepID=UPI0005F3BE14|nr:PREDICTED: cytochrome P450 9e2-like [Vollenhovia emeryi]
MRLLYRGKDLNYFKKHEIPHVTPLPIVGNLGSMIIRSQSASEFVMAIYILTPINVVDLISSGCTWIIVILSIKIKDPLLGKNLIVLRGNRWREMRPIFSPAFTSSKMKRMYKLISNCSVDFGNYLAQLPPEKRIMEMKGVFTRYTNDVIATCAFGVNVDSMRNPENEFLYVW